MMPTKMLRIILFALMGMVLVLPGCTGKPSTDNTDKLRGKPPIGTVVTAMDGHARLLYHDSKENYWFGSKAMGVYKYDGHALTLFTTNDGLCSHMVLSIQEDDAGNLYFDTPNGICKYNGERFSKLEVAEGSKADRQWQTAQGDLWFSMGWQHNGPFRYDGQSLHPLAFPENEKATEFYTKYPNAAYNPYGIFLIYQDSKQNSWFGTANLGIYMFDGKQLHWQYDSSWTERPNGQVFGIRSIAEDPNGFYWICHAHSKYQLLPGRPVNGGLKYINLQAQAGFVDENELWFIHMQADNDGVIWMLTFEQGVWKNDGTTLTQHFILVNGKKVSPNAVYLDRKGTLWFGTDGHGIYQYNGQEFVKFEL